MKFPLHSPLLVFHAKSAIMEQRENYHSISVFLHNILQFLVAVFDGALFLHPLGSQK